MTGRIVRWDSVRKFGFVRTEARRDFFVHASALAPGTNLRKGQYVEFEPVPDAPRGPRAVDVRPLEPAPAESRRDTVAPGAAR